MAQLQDVAVVEVEQLQAEKMHLLLVLTIALEEQELQVLLLDHLLQDQ